MTDRGTLSETLRHPSGRILSTQPVHVYQAGTVTPAVLYQSPTSATTADNPAWTDTLGRLTVSVDPGRYDLVGPAGVVVATVVVMSDTDDVAVLSALPVVIAQWYVAGGLTVAAFAQRIPAPFAATLTGTKLAIGTAPTTQAVIVDVKKAGTTIYTTQAHRPQVAATATSGADSGAPDVAVVAAGDLLTVAVAQVGTGTAGSDLTVQLLGVPVL